MERLWAPWRLAYIQDLYPQPSGCFLCQAWAAAGEEEDHLVLARRQNAFVIMNRFPYNNGHLMVAPGRHIGEMEDVTADESAELWHLATTCKRVLAAEMNAQGANIGINQGRCAGAGVTDHIHIHIVPRWEGDTNYMPILSDVKVMPQLLCESYEQLRPAFAASGF